MERGASIDVADSWGNTALHYPVYDWRDDILQLLLGNGANIDWKNKDGETVVDIARRLRWEHGVTLLMSTAHGHIAQIAEPVL